MSAVGYAITVLIIAVIVLAGLVTLYWGRGRRPRLVIHITAPVITPVNNRPEWYLDFVAEFANVSRIALSVSGVRCAVSTPKQPMLDAKRVLGDAENERHAASHPPDIALRLPFEVAPGARVNYRFHVFFSVHLRRMWDTGLLHLYASAGGATYEGVRVLTAPEADPGIPPVV